MILFAPNPAGPLQKVAEAGGTATVATVLDPARKAFSHRWPWFLPDGRHFLYASVVRASNKATIYQASIDLPQESRIVAQTNTNAVFASGCMLYLRDTTLMAQPFDLKRLATAGEAVPIAERAAGIANSEFGFFTISNNAKLLFQSSAQAVRTLALLDRSGKQLGNAGDADQDSWFSVSPDGKRVLLSLLDRRTHNSNLWIYDFARNLRSRFTFGAASEIRAVWSPDGSEIIFNSNPKGHLDLYRKLASGGGTEELLFADNVDKYPTSASPDGKFVMYFPVGGPTDPKTHLWALPLQGERKPFPFSPSAFNEDDGKFSHDGKWVAYASDESGRFEIYVAPFPGTGGKRQVSVEGGFGPVWRADGKELFFVGLIDGRVMAAEIGMS